MPLLESCKTSLDAATSEAHDKVAFDHFLTALTRIHDEIYMTYVVYCSEGLNIEASVANLEAKANEIKAELAALEPKVSELGESLDAIYEKNSKLDTVVASQDEKLENSDALIAEIEKAKTSALASAEVLTKYENNARNEQDTINGLARKATKTDQHIKQLVGEVSAKTKLIDETLSKASAAAIENEKQQTEIKKTLEAASKYGMAASFKERKNELKTPMLLWSLVFVVAIGALFATGAIYIIPHIKEGEIPKASDILIKLTLVSPLIWLGWMAAKQYGYVVRIREDYSFKYASALAFEGYKKEALNVDPELLRSLLDVATSNMALNPLRIYSHDNNEASPLHDAVSKLLRSKSKSDVSPPN